jgi:hypothetical protein
LGLNREGIDMSLRAVLGTSLALILVSPGWTAAAPHKPNQSSVVSDRHKSPARSARKEAVRDQPQKGRLQKEATSKQSTQKGRADKETSQKEVAQKEAAKKGRAQKETDRKEDARKEVSRKSQAQKDTSRKENDRREATRQARAQKEADQKEEARKETAQKAKAQREESRREQAREEASRARAQREAAQREEARKEAAWKERAQKEAAQREEARREAAQKERALKEAFQKEEAALRQKLRDLQKQLGDMEGLRAELAAVKEQIRGSAPKPTIWGGVPLTVPPSLSTPTSAGPQTEVASLRTPNQRDVDPRPLLPPIDPAAASLPAVIREELLVAPLSKSAVEEAKSYLIKTAVPGYTMMRQGASVAIDRLHPGFAVRLAEALRRARAEGLTEAGVFSAYRPPAFGIGGFSDKFNSLHSYGLATDITGIGRAGSASARRWQQIVVEVGLYLPYGADHRVEFNHTQFIPPKVAPVELRETITADGPKDLRGMWLASGIDSYVSEPSAVAVADSPSTSASADAGIGEPKPVASTPND